MNSPIKILRIIARLNVGGPARHVVWLTAKLNNQEFQSKLISGSVPVGEEDMGYFAVEHGVEPKYIAELSRDLSPKDAISLIKVYRELKEHAPDIVHTHTGKAGTVGRIAAFLYRWLSFGTLIGKPRKLKIVHTFHGHFFHSYYSRLKTFIFLTIEKFLARVATDKIVVISDQQFTEIHERYRVGRTEQFSVIPLGIDLDVYRDLDGKRKILRSEIGAAETEIIVGIIGRLTEVKNMAMFLKLASLYKTGYNDSWPALRFVIIGDGSLRADLEARSQILGLEDSVTFLGNRTDIPNLLPGIDIVALTSNNEGTPLSLIEAMAACRPVISTSVGGVTDLLGNAIDVFDGFSVCERGIAVKHGSAEHFFDGLIYLSNDEKLRKRIAADGKDFINAKYSVDRLESDIISLYRSLIKY